MALKNCRKSWRTANPKRHKTQQWQTTPDNSSKGFGKETSSHQPLSRKKDKTAKNRHELILWIASCVHFPPWRGRLHSSFSLVRTIIGTESVNHYKKIAWNILSLILKSEDKISVFRTTVLKIDNLHNFYRVFGQVFPRFQGSFPFFAKTAQTHWNFWIVFEN